MGAPSNLSDRGAGEMSAAAQMHAGPAMKLNQLTRYYLMTSFFFLLSAFGLYSLSPAMGWTGAQTPQIYLIYGSLVLFLGAICMKFLPSSLGGNPHVYSLKLSLYSYWAILAGTVIWFLVGGLERWSDLLSNSNLFVTSARVLGPLGLFIGVSLLSFNIWKSMEQRV